MKYKNISKQDLTLPGIGLVKAGGIIEQPDGFNNANFEKVEEAKKTKEAPESPKEKSSEKEPSERRTRSKAKEI